MATADKTDIKDRIANNKLTKQILIDMVDSYIDSIDGPLDFENALVFKVDGDNKLVINTDGSYAFWDNGSKKFEQDENGNIAYNGAEIPSDASTTQTQVFYPNGTVERYAATAKFTYQNAYVGVSTDQYYADGVARVTIETDYGTTLIKTSPSGLKGENALFFPLYEQTGSNGNINIKTGGTYASTL